MPKSTTSKEKKVDVADKTKTTVAPKAAVENVEKAKVNAEKEVTVNETKATEPIATEKVEEKKVDVANKNGLPFTVVDGVVTVISKNRAGKSVIGSTGKVITFDADGVAKVEFADAMHFKNVPGFEFK